MTFSSELGIDDVTRRASVSGAAAAEVLSIHFKVMQAGNSQQRRVYFRRNHKERVSPEIVNFHKTVLSRIAIKNK